MAPPLDFQSRLVTCRLATQIRPPRFGARKKEMTLTSENPRVQCVRVGVNPKIGGKLPKWMVYDGQPY